MHFLVARPGPRSRSQRWRSIDGTNAPLESSYWKNEKLHNELCRKPIQIQAFDCIAWDHHTFQSKYPQYYQGQRLFGSVTVGHRLALISGYINSSTSMRIAPFKCIWLTSDEPQDKSLNHEELTKKIRQLSLLIENYETFFTKMTKQTSQARQRIKILRNKVLSIRKICHENVTIDCPINIVGVGEYAFLIFMVTPKIHTKIQPLQFRLHWRPSKRRKL